MFSLDRCFSNCRAKVDVSIPLRMITVCNGTCDYSVRYLWAISEITAWKAGSPVTKEVDHLLENTLTARDYDTLAIKENTLLSGREYRISVKIVAPEFSETVAVYDFLTSIPPFGGNCTVDPTTGTALLTRFRFKCEGWEDDDILLSYKVYYKMEESSYILADTGTKQLYSVRLPEGKAADSYEVETRVDIVDFLGSASSVDLRVTVCKLNVEPSHVHAFQHSGSLLFEGRCKM